DQPIASSRVEDLVEDLEQLRVALAVERVRAQRRDRFREDPFDNARRVADNERAQPCAPDDDELGDLDQHHHVPAMHGVAGQDAAKDDDESQYDEHGSTCYRSRSRIVVHAPAAKYRPDRTWTGVRAGARAKGPVRSGGPGSREVRTGS